MFVLLDSVQLRSQDGARAVVIPVSEAAGRSRGRSSAVDARLACRDTAHARAVTERAGGSGVRDVTLKKLRRGPKLICSFFKQRCLALSYLDFKTDTHPEFSSQPDFFRRIGHGVSSKNRGVIA